MKNKHDYPQENGQDNLKNITADHLFNISMEQDNLDCDIGLILRQK